MTLTRLGVEVILEDGRRGVAGIDRTQNNHEPGVPDPAPAFRGSRRLPEAAEGTGQAKDFRIELPPTDA